MRRIFSYHVAKWLLVIGGGLLLGILAFLTVFMIRLYQGPISLQFMQPYIQQALSGPEGRDTISLDNLVVTWGGWDNPLKIQAVNLHVNMDDGALEIVAPTASVGLGVSLLSGRMISFAWIALEDPVLSLKVNLDVPGKEEPVVADKADESLEPLSFEKVMELGQASKKELFKILSDTMDDELFRRLATVRVTNGRLIFWEESSGKKWEIEDVRSETLYESDRLQTSLHAQFGKKEPEISTLSLMLLFDKSKDDLSGTLKIGNLRPAAFGVTETLKVFQAFDLPLDVSLDVKFEALGKADRIDFSVSGKEGQIDLERLTGDKGIVYPVSSFLAKGAVSNDEPRIALDTFLLDLHGPKVDVKALIEKKGDVFSLSADAMLLDVDAASLPRYWPPSVAPNPRTWVTENIETGHVPRAEAHLTAHLDPASDELLSIDTLGGLIVVENATVSYIKPMTPVTEVFADVTFDLNEMTIISKNGRQGEQVLEKGKIVLSGLSAPDQYADIDLTIAGQLSEALASIDEEPLHYATKFGINPQQAKGSVRADLSIAKMPLLSGLKVEDIDIKAVVTVIDASIAKIVAGLDITQANAVLTVNAQGMDVAGTAVVKGVAATVKGRENFSSGSEFDRRYEVKATLTDVQRTALGMNSTYTVAPYVSGPVDIAATVTSQGKKTTIEAALDLQATALAIPELRWRKRVNMDGKGNITAVLNGPTLSAIPGFSLVTTGLNVKGSATFTNKGTPQRIVIDALKIGTRNDLQGSVTFRPDNGLTVAVKGNSFDVSPFIEGDDSEKSQPKAAKSTPNVQKDPLPPMTVSISLGRLWLSPQGGIDRLSVAIKRINQNWESVQITGEADKNPISFSIQAAENGKRNFFGATQNVGAVLRTFGIDRVTGGDAVLSGTIDDTKSAQTSQGILVVKNYRVVRAPLLARLLTIATLTGIVDALQGDGISFSEMTAPFILEDGLLTLKDAHTSGMSLGITVKGEVDLDNSNLAVEGTIAPAHVINGLLGGVPILGDILVHDKGGGVFASLYYIKGPFDNPSISVNPLSTVTPGILRELFSIFDNGNETKARPSPNP